MSRSSVVRSIAASAMLMLAVGIANSADPPPAIPRAVDFRRDVHPILTARCFKCHTGSDPSSGVRLDDLDEVTGESTGAPLVVVGRRLRLGE